MEEHNQVQLIGNVARELELRTTGTGKKVGSFRLGVSGRQASSFFTVVCWEQQAELAAGWTQGTRVKVQGRLQSREWATENGDKRSAVEVVAETLERVEAQQVMPA